MVDVDLEKFFDRVNHDVLMDRLARRIDDKAVLRLIRRYLNAGVMGNGVVMERYEGTPQGGPLSPLLANVLLDEVDQELERRGHRFVRYADDCNVYVRSQKAGERVLDGLRKLYDRLHLKVNEAKSAVASAFGRKFLGYSLWLVGREARSSVRLRTRRWPPSSGASGRSRAGTCGRSLNEVAEELRRYLPGWKAYFRLAQTPKVFRATGRMVTAPPACRAAQALATGNDGVSGAAGVGCDSESGGPQGGRQQPPLVAQQPHGAEPGRCPLPTSTGSACPDSHDLNFSNRPVRTRMPGGVGGARSGILTAPIPIAHNCVMQQDYLLLPLNRDVRRGRRSTDR